MVCLTIVMDLGQSSSLATRYDCFLKRIGGKLLLYQGTQNKLKVKEGLL